MLDLAETHMRARLQQHLGLQFADCCTRTVHIEFQYLGSDSSKERKRLAEAKGAKQKAKRSDVIERNDSRGKQALAEGVFR